MTLSNAQADAAEVIKVLVVASDAAARQSIEKAIEAGHALIAAKSDCPHGTWLPFLERAGVQERKAQRLMKLAESGFKSDTVSDLGGIVAAIAFATKMDKFAELLGSLEGPGWHDLSEKLGPSPEREDVIQGLADAIEGGSRKARNANIAKLRAAMDIWEDIGDDLKRLFEKYPGGLKQLLADAKDNIAAQAV